MADLVVSGVNIPDRRTIELMRTELACVSRCECDRRCEDCDLVQDVDELIAAFREVIRVLEAVASAIQLPEGHGKMGDLDRIVSFIDYYERPMDRNTSPFKALNAVRDYINLNIIVPAEGEGDINGRSYCNS